MELKQLQSFCAVVKYKSFTKAAEKLYLSQPTVSTHVRQLEEEFQTSLIVRTTKSVEVTPRGQELYECACNIVNLRDNLMRSWSDEDEKMIRIGASTIPSAYILPEILPAFRAIRPATQFHVFQSDSQGIVDGLMCGAFDMGLIGVEVHEEMLELTPFYADQMVLITPVNEHFLRFRDAGGMTLADICREPMLLREKGSGSKKCVSTYFERMGVDENDLTVTARLNDQESIKNLVAGGLGVSIISSGHLHHFRKSRRGRGKGGPFDDVSASGCRSAPPAVRGLPPGRSGQRPDPAVHPFCQELLSLSMCSAGETGHFLSLAP